MSRKLKCSMFGGGKAEQQNVLMSALMECAEADGDIYDYLRNTPKTSLVVELVDMVNELGYSIRKKKI